MSGHATVNIGGSCSSGGDGNRDEPKATASSWDVVPVWTRDWGSSGDRTENLTGCTVDHSGLENEETKSRVATGLPKEQLGISTLIHCGSPQSHWNDPVPQLKPMGNLTTAEFCELKLFRSPDVTLIIGHDEVVFTVPQRSSLPELQILRPSAQRQVQGRH